MSLLKSLFAGIGPRAAAPAAVPAAGPSAPRARPASGHRLSTPARSGARPAPARAFPPRPTAPAGARAAPHKAAHAAPHGARRPQHVCPYCRAPVAKLPKYKALCARCGQTYFVRTRPGDSHPTLLTARETAAVDENRVKEPPPPPILTREERIEERTFNWFWTYSGAEGQWRKQKRALALHARDGNWLLYRNARFEMAEIRRKQARLREALEIYLEVWYLDLNGPQDCWGVVAARRLYETAPFQPSRGLTTPVVARWTNRIGVRLHMDVAALRALFLDAATRCYQTLSLPVTPRAAWEMLAPELVV